MSIDTTRFIDRIQKIKSKLRLNYKQIAKTSNLQVSLVTRISIRYNNELLGQSRRYRIHAK